MSQATSLTTRKARIQEERDGHSKRRRTNWVSGIPVLIWLSLILIGLVIVIATAAPLIAPADPARQNLIARLAPPAGFGGTLEHPLGTDQLGRDVLSRVIFGARVSLGIGVVGMLVGLSIGVTIGILAGFIGGLVDELFMFLVDVQLALPFMIIALTGIAIFGTSIKVLILVVGFYGWESYARLARGMVLASRKEQYVQAANALGASTTRVMFLHILPNILSPLIVLATFKLTGIILLETTLSFLGIGVQPPTPSWGSMIGEGRNYLNTSWWIAVVPGTAIVLTTMSISLIGDWLRDVLDPTLRVR